ncbi:MAG TPA: hypothetical protein VGF85_00030 [Opitutaceae bacterium]|jgi:hypothetical protein
MKTAVLVSGQMRTLEYCLPSIQKHVLSRIGSYDVIAHIAEDEDAWTVEMLEPRKCAVVKQPNFDEKNFVHRSGRGVSGIQQVLRMFWSMEESNRLRHEVEAETGVAYDWVVRLRPDTEFFSDIEDLAACDPAAVHIPTFCNYWGLNDRFAFGGGAAMDAYHMKCGLLDSYVEQGGIYHPESFLKWAVDRAGIAVRRTEVIFDSVRKNRSRITPHWDASMGDIAPEWKRLLAAS